MSNRTNQRRNRALRETMVGGDDLLDALELVHRLDSRLRERGLPGTEESGRALAELLALRDLMTDLARSRSI